MKFLAGVFGVLAGLVALVYVFGGIVLLLRLQMKGLRAEVVVATLPREFLVSVGLAVLLQLIVLIALLVVPAWPRSSGLQMLVIIASASLAVGVLVYPLWRWIGLWDWWLLLVFLAAIATWFLFVWLLMYAFDSERDRFRGGVLVVLVAFAIFLPWRVALEWVSLEGLDVRLCLTGQDAESLDGLFIGENETSVYIGETDTDQPRIAEIPRDAIERLYLGKGAHDTPCATRSTSG